ncbi:MAG: hypothetical protein A2Y41_03535 [Spirochaetes bacterium GWB1_36_13]|nr:MAG: hypothetical protein A2Y41_03535 [Spirochaetes bacterium GWB1_36_13]
MKKNKFLLSFIFLTLFAASHLYSQAVPVILVKNESGKEVPLKMSELSITVKTVGNLAVTTMEMTFYNDLNRVLEGSFYFPLGEGQTVSRFALEVNGAMREGVVVEKDKGREVFETVVRKKIDPGLLEWTKGNNFKSRIYPIPSKGYKKLIIAYEQELKDKGKGFLYFLPLGFKDPIDQFSIKADVLKQDTSPIFENLKDFEGFRFKKWNENYTAEFSEKNYTADKPLSFLLPKTAAYQDVVIEKDPRTGKNYFYIHLNPEIIQTSKKIPKKIALFLDVSSSSEKRNQKKEIELLDRYFKKIGNFSLQLIFFSNQVNESAYFEIQNGDWNKLKEKLLKADFDGGTQLGALDFKNFPADEIIFLSDGISNFGSSEIRLSDTPVIAINSQSAAQHSYLKFISQKTGGVYLNLNEISLEEAEKLILFSPYSYLSFDCDSSAVSEVYPNMPTAVKTDFSVSGILKENQTEIKLNFGIPGNKMKTYSFKLDIKKTSDSGIIPRIWAQKKIEQLDMEYKKYEKDILRIGKDFSIVTRNTSLIVLDLLDDYVRFKIIPPEEEMKKQYYEIIGRQENEFKFRQKDKLDRLAGQFHEFIQWWNTEFSLNDPPQSEERMKKMSRMESEGEIGSEERSVSDSTKSMDMDNFSKEEEVKDESILGKKEDKKPEGGEEKGADGLITLQKWDPQTPYLEKLKKTTVKDIYPVYLELKKSYAESSAFFLDVSDFFLEKKQPETALRILSNIAEMELENPQLLRILAHRLAQLKYYRLSAFVFEEVLKMRPEEPQSYRDLALVYANSQLPQKAIDILYEALLKEWDSRFPNIEITMLHEMNQIIALNSNLKTDSIDKRLIQSLPVDIRVVLNWDADNTDMDLWVTDPNNEKCYYAHQLTYLGGKMSNDFTGGYGPEFFVLKKAKKGKYLIEINYYGNHQQTLAGTTTVQIELYLNYGRKNQIKKEITLRLKDQQEVIKAGEFEIKENSLK